jgi:hypothetical protein
MSTIVRRSGLNPPAPRRNWAEEDSPFFVDTRIGPVRHIVCSFINSLGTLRLRRNRRDCPDPPVADGTDPFGPIRQATIT